MISLLESDKTECLTLAKNALFGYVSSSSFTPVMSHNPRLQRSGGVFVSLYKKGDLRGCIGRIQCDDPLYQTIQQMAIKAGCNDPRFSNVTKDEYGKLSFEITVLGEITALPSVGDIVLGKHGLYLQKGEFSSVFLPQVPVTQGWTLEQYLEELSLKAGLTSDGWKTSDLFWFEGVVFS